MLRDEVLAENWKLPASGIIELDVVNAHRHCTNNRDDLFRSSLCGCFWCLETFSAKKIWEWADGGITALCPFCGIDSVIGSASGYPVERCFLRRMHGYWAEPVPQAYF